MIVPEPPNSDVPPITARRDGEEHESGPPCSGLDGRDPHRLEDAGERGERAAEHEVADLDRADVDAALARADAGCRPWRRVWSPQRVR